MGLNLSAIPKKSLLGRLLRRPLILLPPGLSVPILQGPLRGKRWIVGSSNHGCWLGSYEFGKQRRFAEMVRPGAVVYDIGANVGFYTLLAATLVGPEGTVVAFEPLPRNLHFLSAHISMNGLTNVVVRPVALADRSGTLRFDDSGGPSEGRLAAEGSKTVECATLDALAAEGEIPPPDVIKMDVEGAELLVLRGGEATIRTHRPTLFIATHGADVHAACVAWLEEAGFRLDNLDGESVQACSELLAFPVPR